MRHCPIVQHSDMLSVPLSVIPHRVLHFAARVSVRAALFIAGSEWGKSLAVSAADRPVVLFLQQVSLRFNSQDKMHREQLWSEQGNRLRYCAPEIPGWPDCQDSWIYIYKKLQTHCTQHCAHTYAAHRTLLHLLVTRRHDASVARYTVNMKAATVRGL